MKLQKVNEVTGNYYYIDALEEVSNLVNDNKQSSAIFLLLEIIKELQDSLHLPSEII